MEIRIFSSSLQWCGHSEEKRAFETRSRSRSRRDIHFCGVIYIYIVAFRWPKLVLTHLMCFMYEFMENIPNCHWSAGICNGHKSEWICNLILMLTEFWLCFQSSRVFSYELRLPAHLLKDWTKCAFIWCINEHK